MSEAVPHSGEFCYCIDDLIIDIRRQRVLRGGTEISLSPLSFELLLALVRAAPELVSLDTLMKRVWPEAVVSAETVSQRVKLVRDALGDHADAPRYIAGVRGRGYRIVAAVRPVPAESSSGVAGLVAPAEPASSPSFISGAQYRRLAGVAAIGGVAVLAAVFLVGRQPAERAEAVDTASEPAAEDPAPTSEVPLLVVLPFENLGREEDEYFADGMTDEVSARLAKIRSIGVIGRASAIHYKDTSKSVPEIAEELGVDYILDGSVRWEHDADGSSRVRITPQLVRTVDARQLWADVYEEPLPGIFRVQAAIAERVAGALDLTLVEPERRALRAEPTDNPEAYAYYLRGDHYRWRSSHGEADQEIHLRMYERAVDLDPEFALAHAAIAHTHIRMYWFHHDHTPERLVRAKAAVDRALELDPDLPQAHWVLGMYYYWGYLDYDRALAEFELARNAAPHYPWIRNGIGVVSRRQGRWQEAIENFKIAVRLDPLEPGFALNLGQTYLLVQDYENAERYLRKSIDLAPDRAQAYDLAWVYLAQDGHTRRARAVLEEAPRVAGEAAEKLLLLGLLRLDLLDRDFQGVLDRIAAISWPAYDSEEEFQPMALFRAYAYEGLGQPDLARENFNRAVMLLETALQEQPFEPRLHSSLYGSLGIAYAGSGWKEEALQAGRRAVELLPVERDALAGRVRLEELARIYTRTGEHDDAVELLGFLLTPGSGAATPLSIPFLRLDPAWDPLRGHPRFQALVARQEP